MTNLPLHKREMTYSNFQVTIERVYTTTINVSAATEAEAIIVAQEGLAELELEQMNVDISDIRVERLDD